MCVCVCVTRATQGNTTKRTVWLKQHRKISKRLSGACVVSPSKIEKSNKDKGSTHKENQSHILYMYTYMNTTNENRALAP